MSSRRQPSFFRSAVLFAVLVLIPVGFLAFERRNHRSPSIVDAAADSTADVRAVESALRDWYDASARHDSTAYAARLLPEFFIFEDTTRYDKATLLRLVVSGFAEGTDRATISDLHTVVADDAAWTSFRNTEVFTPNGSSPTPARRYLETAIFRRVDGRWLIERYHATRINRPPPKAAP